MVNRTNTNNPNNPLKFEIRKVQQQSDGRSYSLVIPNRFSRKMGISKGDLMKIYLEDNRLLISERINLEGVSGNAAIDVNLGGLE
jgi:hypothetical protein